MRAVGIGLRVPDARRFPVGSDADTVPEGEEEGARGRDDDVAVFFRERDRGRHGCGGGDVRAAGRG